MKKKLVVMCMLFITCVVTSCSGNNNGKTEADNIQTQTFPQQYRYSSEHLRIDLQEITPQEVSWKNGTATECSLDYEKVGSLRIEARQKLEEYRPISIGQASRISGVSPADISVLLVYLASAECLCRMMVAIHWMRRHK